VDWLVNLRGSDIKYNPVFFAYLIFYPGTSSDDASKAKLFIQGSKVREAAI
jgi:hypothetical protein